MERNGWTNLSELMGKVGLIDLLRGGVITE